MSQASDEEMVACPCCVACLPCEEGPHGGRACTCCMMTGRVPIDVATTMVDYMDPWARKRYKDAVDAERKRVDGRRPN